MKLKAKIYGIIGSALISLSILPSLSVFFMIVGLFLVGIAVYLYSKEDNIFNYFLLASVLSIVASVLFYYKIFAVIFSFFMSVFSPQNPIIPITTTIVIYFLVFYILNILSAIFFKKTFDALGNKYNNPYFKYSGYFLVIGAFLNIFIIGLIIYTLGWVGILLGFFTMEEIYNTEIIEPELLEEKN